MQQLKTFQFAKFCNMKNFNTKMLEYVITQKKFISCKLQTVVPEKFKTHE